MAASRIHEPELKLPALFCIDRVGEISTTDLSNCLRELFNPQGEDIEILRRRADDKFSQIVRNLRSHQTLEIQNLATYTKRGRQGYWTLTSKGKELLEVNRPLLEYLIEQRFEYELQQDAFAQIEKLDQVVPEQLNLFDESIKEEDMLILEGANKFVKQKTYERSAKLREAAITYYSVKQRIFCQVCGFDFSATYGPQGDGFIEVHHLKPIFSYGAEDIAKTLEQALQNVVPVCSNCHRMIHRKRGRMLSIEELKEMINAARAKRS